MKEFTDDNSKLDEIDRKFSKSMENNVGKKRKCSLRAISPFSTVFPRLVLQTRSCLGKKFNRGLFGKGLTTSVWLQSNMADR